MTGPTHALTAAAAAVPAAALTHTPLLLIAPVAAAGALLPDVDEPHALAGRRLPYLAAVLGVLVWLGARSWGLRRDWQIGLAVAIATYLLVSLLHHRGPTHSPGAGALVVIPVVLLVGIALRLVAPDEVPAARLVTFEVTLGLALFGGWLLHLVCDTPSPTPMPWGWPFYRKRIRPAWVPKLSWGRFPGSLLEWLIGASCSIVLLAQALPYVRAGLHLLLQLPQQGT